jgi:hypothetical protein
MPSELDCVSHWFIGAHLHVATSDRTPWGFSSIRFKSHKHLISIHEYYVIKNGYDENRLTKQNNLTAVLNTRQGKLLNRTPTDKDTFLHNLSNHPKEYKLATCTGMDKHNGHSCERYTFLY